MVGGGALALFFCGLALGDGGDGGFDIFLEVGVGDGEGSPVEAFDELDGAHLGEDRGQLLVRVMREQVSDEAHQRRDVVAGFTTKLVLVAEAEDILDIGDEMVWICMQNGVDK